MTATIDALVARRAAETPQAPALVAAGSTLTYRELDDAAMAWHCQLSHRGVTAGTVVTVRLPREPRLVAVLLGLLRCGAAYLAADPAWSRSRVAAAAEQAGGPLLVGDADAGAGWGDVAVLAVGPEPAGTHRHDARSAPELPACVFLTSGSTGRPKAVLSPHRAAVAVLTGQRYADFGPGCRMLQAAPLAWDGLTLELWGPLLNGGTVVLADAEADPALRLRRQVRRDGLTTVWLTAAVFHALLDDDPDAFSGLRHVLTGGERVSPDHVSRFLRRHPSIRLTNGYGPCEATVFTTVHDVTGADTGDVPLGRPLRGVTLAAPSGPATGEIVVGGPGLSHGYLGDPRATAAAFVPAPDGRRWYRTGDLGALDDSGRLRFRGRADRQLKIRGQRLEPEEVEDLLRRTLPIAAAAVTPRRDARGAVTGVVGHVVPLRAEASTSGWVARVRAAESPVPPELRPALLTVHTRLPVLPSGKVDYAALESSVRPRAVPAEPSTDGTAAPDQELELVLAAARELGLPAGPDTDLFAAGLDSLTVVRLLGRLHRHRPRSLAPIDVYRHPTPAALARAWAGVGTATGSGSSRRLPRAVTEMWLHEQLEPGDHGALVACAFRVGPDFDRDRWARAVGSVARRHAALGTLLDLDGDRLRRIPAGESRLDALSAGRPWPAAVQAGDGTLKVPRGTPEPFDLAAELPWRWHLHRGSGTLLLLFHHVAIDGWSEPLVLADLGRAYRGTPFAGPPPPEPVDPMAADSGFWARTLARAVRPVVPAPAPARSPGEPVPPPPRISIPAGDLDLATGGRTGPARQQALLAALAEALRTTADPEPASPLVVGVADAGRDDATAEHVGLLVRVLPVALERGADPGPAWLDAVAHANELILADVTALLGRDERDRPAPFPVVLVLHSRPPADLDLGWPAPRVPVRLARPPFDVLVEGWPAGGGGVHLVVEQDTELVDPAWAGRLATEMAAALRRSGRSGSAPR